jgi:hypothetical protein
MSDQPDAAMQQLEVAISRYPYSRMYAALADALERKATGRSREDELRRRAVRLAEYAATLARGGGLPTETRTLLGRLELGVNSEAAQSAQLPITNGHASPNGDQ